jgi:hypothetical protein
MAALVEVGACSEAAAGAEVGAVGSVAASVELRSTVASSALAAGSARSSRGVRLNDSPPASAGLGAAADSAALPAAGAALA